MFIHPQALVETKTIGQDTKVWAFVHILPGAAIGKNCNICDLVFIENNVILGNNVTVKSGIHIWDGVTIEDDVFLGPNVVFTNDIFPRSKVYPDKFEKTLIKRGASIGANSTIIAGNTIGEWAMVGAGSVVTKDVPNFTMVYGNPARFKGFICRCTKAIPVDKDQHICVCGRKFNIAGINCACVTPE